MTVSAKVRKSLPASRMGLPGQDKYPMPDPKHAAIAKSYATTQERRGNLTPQQKAHIDSIANAILNRRG